MEIDYVSIGITIINFVGLFAIVVGIYKLIWGFKKFINRNKEMDEKINNILNKLENKEGKEDS